MLVKNVKTKNGKPAPKWAKGCFGGVAATIGAFIISFFLMSIFGAGGIDAVRDSIIIAPLIGVLYLFIALSKR